MAWSDYYNTQPQGSSGGYISMLEGYAQNYMNPNSQYNRGQFNQFNQMGQDSAAAQGQQGLRMQAAGQNPFANQQYRAASAEGVGQAHNAYMQQNQQSQAIGANYNQMAMQTRMQMAQQAQQQAQMDREYKQHRMGQWLGLGGTLMSAALTGPIGGAAATGLKSLFTKKPVAVSTTGAQFAGPQNQQYAVPDTSGWRSNSPMANNQLGPSPQPTSFPFTMWARGQQPQVYGSPYQVPNSMWDYYTNFGIGE